MTETFSSTAVVSEQSPLSQPTCSSLQPLVRLDSAVLELSHCGHATEYSVQGEEASSHSFDSTTLFAVVTVLGLDRMFGVSRGSCSKLLQQKQPCTKQEHRALPKMGLGGECKETRPHQFGGDASLLQHPTHHSGRFSLPVMALPAQSLFASPWWAIPIADRSSGFCREILSLFGGLQLKTEVEGSNRASQFHSGFAACLGASPGKTSQKLVLISSESRT